jgi:hypothetical protein
MSAPHNKKYINKVKQLYRTRTKFVIYPKKDTFVI